MTRRQPEYELQCTVAEHLRLRSPVSVYWCAIPNGGLRNKAVAAQLKRSGVRAGAPDLLVIVRGTAYGVELKAKGGKPSPAQIDTHVEWQMAGGAYQVCTGLDETLEYLEKIGAII
jgi:hypothetical protein